MERGGNAGRTAADQVPLDAYSDARLIT